MTKIVLRDTEEAVQNAEEAHRHLKKAQEYQKGSGLLYAAIYFAMGTALLVYDYINSR